MFSIVKMFCAYHKKVYRTFLDVVYELRVEKRFFVGFSVIFHSPRQKLLTILLVNFLICIFTI